MQFALILDLCTLVWYRVLKEKMKICHHFFIFGTIFLKLSQQVDLGHIFDPTNFFDHFQPLASTVASERSKMNLTESDQKQAQMIPNYVQIDMVIVSINTGNHTISLNKHTIGLEIYNSTRQYTFRPMRYQRTMGEHCSYFFMDRSCLPQVVSMCSLHNSTFYC